MNETWFKHSQKTCISQSGGDTIHVFAQSEPDGNFPLHSGKTYFKLPHEGEHSEKLRAWEFIHRHGYDPSRYRYHGRWKRNFKVEGVHFKWEFIEFDDEVKKAFKTKETSNKFGL